MVKKLIVIGASTGGPGRLHTILEHLPRDFDSTIIIAQHMSPPFIPSFVKQLSSITPLNVRGVSDKMVIESSSIYICSGACRLREMDGDISFFHSEPSDLLYSPDVDILFLSAAELSGSIDKMGIILSGIGDDGARGAKALFEAGGMCIFESEESSTVYGMPRCAIELVPQAEVGTMPQIIQAICNFGAKSV